MNQIPDYPKEEGCVLRQRWVLVIHVSEKTIRKINIVKKRSDIYPNWKTCLFDSLVYGEAVKKTEHRRQFRQASHGCRTLDTRQRRKQYVNGLFGARSETSQRPLLGRGVLQLERDEGKCGIAILY